MGKFESEKESPLKEKLSQSYAQARLIVSYLIQDVKRGPMQLKIAVFSIFIIVAFMSILLNANGLTMTMFLSLAERQVGDADFIIVPQLGNLQFALTPQSIASGNIISGLQLMNTTEVENKLKSIPEVIGASSRWILPGQVQNPKNLTISTPTFGLVGDSLKEISIGLGRSLEVDPLDKNECYFLTQTADMIELDDEDKEVIFRVDLIKFASQYGLFDGINPGVNDREVILKIMRDTVPANIEINIQALEDSIGTLENVQTGNQALNDILKNLTNGIDAALEGTSVIRIPTEPFIEFLADTALQLLQLDFPLQIKYRLDSPKGKWAENLGSVVFLDQNYFFERLRNETVSALNQTAYTIAENITGTTNQTAIVEQIATAIQGAIVDPFVQFYDGLKLTETAISMNAVVENKGMVYGSFQTFSKKLIQISNEIMYQLGDPAEFSITSPMLLGFQFLGYVSMFVENIIYAILIVLAILSYILISSLMIFNIEEKTYEFGMLRALGFKRQSLVYLLFLQGVVFAICGWTLGLITAYVGSSLLKFIFFREVRIKVYYTMEALAWIASLIFGFATPIFTNVFSIRKSLAQNLKDSLDLYRRSVNTMTIIFVKLAKLGISRTQFILALELTVYGFTFYYFAPLTFFYNRVDLFLLLLNMVLLGMVLGMTIIANLVQPYLEKFFIWLLSFFLCSNKSLKIVIEKNLKSHSARNQKTALMITMSVCFIIFSGSGIAMQAKGLINQLVSRQGGDLVLTKTSFQGMDEGNIRNFLEDYNKRYPGTITGFSFTPRDFKNFQYVTNVEISPLSFYPKQFAFISGVQPSVMKSVDTQFYVPERYEEGIKYEKLPSGLRDGVSSLFQDNFDTVIEDYDKNNIIALNQFRNQKKVEVMTINAVIPTGYTEFSGLDVGVPAMLTITGIETIFTRINITHTADRVPGFAFSKYQSFALANHDILISIDAWNEIFKKIKTSVDNLDKEDVKNDFYSYRTNAVLTSQYEIPYTKLLVKLADSTSKKDRSRIKNGIKNFAADTDIILDTVDIKQQTETSLAYLSILNAIIALLTTTIAFFMLLISLIKNIKDNIWELGILRSIGLNNNQIYIIYFAETLTVIVSALALGSIVGMLTAISGTVYYVIFFELPFSLYFPTFEFTSLLIFLLITSVLTTWIGLKGLVYLPIAKILKGLI